MKAIIVSGCATSGVITLQKTDAGAPEVYESLFLVPEVGLEPTKPYGGRFTVSCDCHYTIPARGADSGIRTQDLLFTKQLL